jgi:hypothetical protein
MKALRYVCFIFGIAALFASCGNFINKKPEPTPPPGSETPGLIFASTPIYSSPFMSRANQLKNYAMKNGLSTSYCFFVDMSIHGGRKRFFVYDLESNTVVISGLVAHGSCGDTFLNEAKFSNVPGCGCTSVGKYKIGERYRGHYGKSYKLYGLESTNSNAYRRAIVLHGFSCVPDEEIYPKVVCNSLGCAMVSPAFFEKLSSIIDRSNKPIVLWIYK